MNLSPEFKIDPKELGVSYRYLVAAESKETVLFLENNIKSQKSSPTLEGWDSFWKDVSQSGQIEPFWLTHNNKKIYRWNNTLIHTEETRLEKKYIEELRKRIFKKYLKGYQNLIEFGAGSGHNLLAAKDMFPTIIIWGTDFSEAAVSLMRKNNINAEVSNMKKRDFLLDKYFPFENTCCMTIGSMEQLGEDYKVFTDYLLSKKCLNIHIEPIKEFYSGSRLDLTAARYHEKRGYLGNFFSYLKDKCNILEYGPTTFGNIYNSGYSIIIWENK